MRSILSGCSFRHFELELTAAQRELLADLKIDKPGIYHNFAAADLRADDLTKFCKELGNEPTAAQRQGMALGTAIEAVQAAFEAEAAWITVRATKRNPAFDISRWHQDGYYYEPFDGDQHKAVFSAKGPGTLLAVTSEHECARLRALAEDDRAGRNVLINAAKIDQTPAGCGTVFIAGSDRAAWHSEPPLAVDRLFVSVLPGSRPQIEELRQRWKMAAASFSY